MKYLYKPILILIILQGSSLCAEPAIPLYTDPFESVRKSTGMDITADSFEVSGDNIIAEGNLKLRKGDMLLYADKGVINYTSKLAEVSGNVRMYSLVHTRKEVEYWELSELEKNPEIKLKIVGTVMTPSGRQKIVVDMIYQNISWQGKKAVGNMISNTWYFGKFASQIGTYSYLGDSGTRYPDGKFEIRDAEVSSCPGLIEGHSVFSIKSAKVVAYPPKYSDRRVRTIESNYAFYPQNDEENSSGDSGDDYSAWMYNNLIYIGDLPVFWLPVLYKPPTKYLRNWTVQVGGDSAWGTFVNTTNHWQIYDSDDLSLSLTNMLDYYSKRSIGVGNQTMLDTADSKTEFFGYLIPDADPSYNYPTYSRFGQLNPWNVRYDVDIKNMTHLSEGLDFRGRFAKLSDFYFLYAFFDNIALTDPQPATYANLNYEQERYSLGLTVRPQVNTFYSVIEKLPELTLNAPRQEVWNNIYYESSSSLGFYEMKWRDFEISRQSQNLGNGVEPANYYSGRFDTTHFLYRPVDLNWVNIVPRAGIKFTGYTNSSEQAITANDLYNMLIVQMPESQSQADIVNYDNKGGGKARFIGELGVSATSKFYRSWSNVKNAFFELDGIRHVIQPYIDYTWIPSPTVNRDNLYYFDDVDRITEQNFARFGIQNRLQTRRGEWGNSQIYTWAESETYVDFLFGGAADNNYFYQDGVQYKEGIKNLGDIGQKLRINATDKLSFNFDFLLDGQKLTSKYYLNSIDRVSLGTSYKLADGWSTSLNWFAGNNQGLNEGQYSMGSSFTRLQAGSVFERLFYDTSNLSASLNFKVNDRTSGIISANYQFVGGMLPGATIAIQRQLPCNLVLLLSGTLRQQNNSDGNGSNLQANFGISLGFTASPNYSIKPRESLLPSTLTRLTS